LLAGAFLRFGAPRAFLALRFRTLDELVERAGLRQDEVRTLAALGALASFGGDRRTALWQAERAGRPAGPLLRDEEETTGACAGGGAAAQAPAVASLSPLAPMTLVERVRADYDGMGLTIGPHPMRLVRGPLAARGVARAADLAAARAGRRVRVAGAVITRQRPGTAKGFVFLSLEDETGIANVIVTPDVFRADRQVIVGEPYLLVEGLLQRQQGAVSVKADRIVALRYEDLRPVPSHDFH
jgi:error-prone DNA polymerase